MNIFSSFTDIYIIRQYIYIGRKQGSMQDTTKTCNFPPWFLTRKLFQFFSLLKLWTTLKEDHSRIIPVKLCEIPTSGLGNIKRYHCWLTDTREFTILKAHFVLRWAWKHGKYSRGQKYFNIALVLQDEWLTIFTPPANPCTCPLKVYAIKNILE